MEDVIYTIPEAAAKLKVTRAAVYKWMKAGKMPYVFVGTERRITAAGLAAFIKASTLDNMAAQEKNAAPRLTAAIAGC